MPVNVVAAAAQNSRRFHDVISNQNPSARFQGAENLPIKIQIFFEAVRMNNCRNQGQVMSARKLIRIIAACDQGCAVEQSLTAQMFTGHFNDLGQVKQCRLHSGDCAKKRDCVCS